MYHGFVLPCDEEGWAARVGRAVPRRSSGTSKAPLARIARQGQAIIESETQLFLWAAEVAARVDCRVPSLSLSLPDAKGETPQSTEAKVKAEPRNLDFSMFRNPEPSREL